MAVLGEALMELFQIQNMLYLSLGLCAGVMVGAIPGLTGMLAVTLCVPLTFGMDAVAGILLLLGIYAGGSYGGSITAILINTPGAPAAAATVLDGYPLARQGKAKKALDMALYASCFGGIVSCILLLFLAPEIARVALRFGAAEYFSLALFGISIISSLSGDNLLKGFISGALGILVGCIGIDALGNSRFVFGEYRLLGGISTVVALIGLFALSEPIINKNMRGTIVLKEKDTEKACQKEGLSWKEFYECRRTIIQSTLIGNVIGAIPGTGGGIASWISYAQARKSSKHGENFGKGELEGIAASEAANNATTGTALIPMLTLGIPGDASTAIMMSALMVHGLAPGPKLFDNYKVTVYAIIFGFIVINVLLLPLGKLLIPIFSRVTHMPYPLLAPVIVSICIAGAYAANNTIFDVYVAVVIAVIAVVLNVLGFPRAPILLGMVLSGILENNYMRAMAVSEGDLSIFITRPISAVFVTLSALSFLIPVLKVMYTMRNSGKRRKNEEV